MPTTELDAFLSGNAKPDEPVPTPAEANPPSRAQSPDAGGGGAGAKTPDADPVEPDGADPASGPREGERVDTRTVPLTSLETERRARQDWKERAARAEAERDALNKQIEEFKRQPQQPPQQPVVPQWTDPEKDPIGAFQERMINHKLDVSEMMLRREIGPEKVDALIKDFQAEMQKDPSLRGRLYAQQDPFSWANKHLEALKLQREVGEDPAAYRARILAEARAEWEAERDGQAPTRPVSVVAGMAPSLAGARSAAGRSAPAYSGPTPLDAILAGRK